MGSAVRGLVGAAIEVNPAQGIVPLLAWTPLATTVNGYSQPASGVAGNHLEIVVMANTTTGTVTIAGTSPSGASISSTTENIAVPPAGQNPVLTAFRHVTANIFATITSVTCSSGLVTGGGMISLGGIQAEKYLLPATFKYTDKKNTYSPNEQTGLPARHTRIQQLLLDEGWDISMACYPESGMFVAYEVFGPPVNIVPIAVSSTVVLKAGGALSGGTITLTNQPGPGSQVQFVVTSSTATGTFVVSGTNFAGAAISETVAASGTNGNGTYTSVNFYWGVTSITYTGLTTASVVVNGVGVPNLLVSTTGAATMTLSTGPSLPGMGLVFVVSGLSSGSGTITVSGTTRKSNGLATATEVITVAANGLYYTANTFASINNGVANQFATTGLSAASIAVYGVFAWQYIWNDITNADLWDTAVKAFYSGTDSKVAPGCYCEEMDFELDTSKEMTFTAKGNAQDIVPLGDRTTTPMSGSRLSALSQPPDLPIVGWQGLAWLDPQYTAPLSSGAGINAYGTLLTCKVSIKVPKEPIYPANQTQRYGMVYYKKDGREFSFEATVDYRDLLQYELWRKNQKQTLSIGVLGPFVGMVGNTMYQKAWYFNMPFKYDQDGVTVESDPSKANVTATYKGMCEYAPELGYSIQFVIINQFPPVYNT